MASGASYFECYTTVLFTASSGPTAAPLATLSRGTIFKIIIFIILSITNPPIISKLPPLISR
jgi:hypothetical protein